MWAPEESEYRRDSPLHRGFNDEGKVVQMVATMSPTRHRAPRPPTTEERDRSQWATSQARDGAAELARAWHAHPTLSEVMGEAAELATFGHTLHL